MFTSGVLWLMTLALPWKQFGAGCGGWGRQGEAKISIVFQFIYRGESAAEGDRQAGRRISTYTHTHTCTSTHQTHQCNQAHSEMLRTYKFGLSIW